MKIDNVEVKDATRSLNLAVFIGEGTIEVSDDETLDITTTLGLDGNIIIRVGEQTYAVSMESLIDRVVHLHLDERDKS